MALVRRLREKTPMMWRWIAQRLTVFDTFTVAV